MVTERGFTYEINAEIKGEIWVVGIVEQRHGALAAHALCHGAGEDIDLIIVCQRNQGVAVTNVSFFKDIAVQRAAPEEQWYR